MGRAGRRLHYYPFTDPQTNRRTPPTPCVAAADIGLVVERLGEPRAVHLPPPAQLLAHFRADRALLRGQPAAETAAAQPAGRLATLADDDDPTVLELRLR